MSWKDGDEFVWKSEPEEAKEVFVFRDGTWWWQRVKAEVERLYDHFEAYDDDVLLCSAGKVGTTWLKTIILCIRDFDSVQRVEAHAAAPCLEIIFPERGIHSASMIGEQARPRFYHSHMPLHNLPKSIREKHCRIVYITRNPKDTIVSAQKFQFGPEEQRVSMEDFTRRFVAGTTSYGPFARHVLEFWEEARRGASAKNPVCFLHYEDMLRDPVQKIQQVAEFIGKPLSAEQAEAVAQRCSMDSIKKLTPNVGVSKLYGMSNSIFFRKGKAGNWREEMSAEQSALVDRYVEEKFKDSGVEFTYEL